LEDELSIFQHQMTGHILRNLFITFYYWVARLDFF